ncbi:MAG: bifunctional glutamate N-acetyltransferase/amino-acid acetyltransferase ArgJ [Clostridiales bacterium]|jgi:glutamate N-acetyltransferase/amino-acid N-acetyltransferase|nr:bifunctional glutamate N-acetyltransferase/amino-acid acetyltransferase ArgJ [Clostridiales bacterium]
MDETHKITGGVCAPKGFKASGTHCGLCSDKNKKDIALIVSEKTAVCAAVYTRNKVRAAPLELTRENLKNGSARAIICNSRNANACVPDGYEKALSVCRLTANALGVSETDIVVASTGVIGKSLDIKPFQENIGKLVGALSENGGSDAADAIMTTDTIRKESAVSFFLDGVEVKIGAAAKGSGMIHPDMATMLAFITTDADISDIMLSKALKRAVRVTFNMISVDRDTSTNDMAVLMANRLAENTPINKEGRAFDQFADALTRVCVQLARMIAADGEGATKLLECRVSGAASEEDARKLARSVVSSNLVKTAMFGADANWGRILCALGYSGAEFDPLKTDISFTSNAGAIDVCKNGVEIDVDEKKAKGILLEKEVQIAVNARQGRFSAVAFGCDLTYDYVRINGDYRT